MRGRRPKPTALKIAEGNPGRRPLNEREPKPRYVIPECPEFLDEDAKCEWRRVSKLLCEHGILSEMDGQSLAAYCQAYSRWKHAELQIQKSGPVILSPDKNFPVQNPYLWVANKAMEQMMKLLVEFGMTPSSRSRVEVLPGHEPRDALDEFLERQRAQNQ